jgi:hypothetical protein
MRGSRGLSTACAVSLLLSAGACSVDDRQLNLDEGGAGAGSNGRGGGAGTTEVPSASGSGGDETPGLVDGCADLDTDGVADCEVTIVDNASFGSDVSPWLADAGTELGWAAEDALLDESSGSAQLKTAGARAAAAQCVVVAEKELVIAYANAFVQPAPGAEDSGHARLEVSFFESHDCSGERFGFFETPPSTVTGAWTTVHAGGLSPEATRSVFLALVGHKPAALAKVAVAFDNVMLKTKTP